MKQSEKTGFNLSLKEEIPDKAEQRIQMMSKKGGYIQVRIRHREFVTEK